MSIFNKIIKKSSQPFDLVQAVYQHDEKAIINHLETKKSANNPAAIPYTSAAIKNDLEVLYQFQSMYKPTPDEFAAAIVSKLLHRTHKSAVDWLTQHSFSAPTKEHMIFISTYLNTISTLKEFSSTGIKKYKVSTCNDERVCATCSKQDGKTHMITNAVIGKTAPPFCEKCRCIIRPVIK